ncbi:MAG: prenyltransferase [Bacteroides sp.]|nr:prenyltransferase [Bacteroides sp.]
MKRHSLNEWIAATRPWSYPASAMPVAVTLAYLYWAGHAPNLLNGLWALLNIILFHAAGNTWSDYFDHKHKVDAEDTFGAKTLTSGQFTPREIFRLSLGLLAAALMGGVLLTLRTGWPLLAIGAAGALCSLLYPKLKYCAWGDAVIYVTYALLPTLGTSFVTTGAFHPEALWITLPSGLITVAILHANNTRDVATDRRAGIRTLAMNIGPKASTVVYMLEVLLPYPLVLCYVLTGMLPWWALAVLLSLPIAIGNCSAALRANREGSNQAIGNLDERSAQLQLLFNLLLLLTAAGKLFGASPAI